MYLMKKKNYGFIAVLPTIILMKNNFNTRALLAHFIELQFSGFDKISSLNTDMPFVCSAK